MPPATPDKRAEETSAVERRLRAELKRQRKRFQTVLEISRTISTILDVDALIEATVNLARERFDLYYAGLFLLDESGEWAVLRAGTGEAGRQMIAQGHRLRVDEESMIGWCVLHKEPRIVSEVSGEEVHFKNPFLPLTRSEMALPLVVRDEVIGALTIQSERADAFSEDDIAILRGMAEQVAVAIVNARLFADVEASREQAEILYTVGRALSTVSDEEQLLRALTQSAVEAGAYRAHLLSITEDASGGSPWVDVAASWLREEDAIPMDGFHFRLEDFPLADALTDLSRPMFVSDVVEDERIDDEIKKMAAKMGVRALVAVPLTLAGRLIGLLAIAWDEVHPFEEWEREFYTAIIGMASPVMGNLRLLKELRAALDEARVLYEVGRQLSTSLDEQEVVLRTLSQMARSGMDKIRLGIYEEKPDGQVRWLDIKAVYEPGQGARLVSGERIALDEIPTLRYVYEHASEGPVVVEHIGESPPEDEGLRAALIERGAQAVALIPVTWRGKPFAVLGVERYEPDYFTPSELNLYQGVASQTAIALQNARLFSEQQSAQALLGRRVRALDCLNDIGRKIEEQPDVADFLRWVAGRIPTAMRYAEDCVTAIEFEGQVYGDERAVTLPSQMVQSIRIGGQALGKIYIAYTAEHSFTDEESAFLGDVTRRVGGYIASRRLLERVQEALNETQTLYQTTADLSAAQTYDDVLAALRKHTLIGDADLNISLNLFSTPWVGDEVPEWSIVLARWTRLPPEATSPRYPLRQFPSASALLHPDRPTLIEDVHTFPDIDDQARALYVQRYKAGSTIFVPLVVHGRWIGYVNAIFSRPTHFPEDKVRLLMALTGQVAIVVQNLRQLEVIQARARREQVLHQVTTRVREFTDPDAVARAAVRELGLALGRPTFLRVGALEPPARRDS